MTVNYAKGSLSTLYPPVECTGIFSLSLSFFLSFFLSVSLSLFLSFSLSTTIMLLFKAFNVSSIPFVFQLFLTSRSLPPFRSSNGLRFEVEPSCSRRRLRSKMVLLCRRKTFCQVAFFKSDKQLSIYFNFITTVCSTCY